VAVPVEKLSASARIFELFEGPSTSTLGLESLELGDGLGDLLGGSLELPGGETAGAVPTPVEDVPRVWEEIDYAETMSWAERNCTTVAEQNPPIGDDSNGLTLVVLAGV